MHEYAVVDDLVHALLPKLAEIRETILCVHLRKGELRILSDWALQNAFEVVTRGTRLASAKLGIEVVRARVHCDHCGYEGRPDAVEDETFHAAIPILACPRCSGRVAVVAGRELSVERVSVADPETPDPVPRDEEAHRCASDAA
jgi:hydrogenase nickel incorporation protein HypA/HybF